MATYDYLKSKNGNKIQVESAKRDGSGKNIENNYAKQNGNYEDTYFGAYSAKVINTYTKINVVDTLNFSSTGGDTDIGTGRATLNSVQGLSVVKNQLISTSFESTTINEVTFTNNGDGSWTVNGTASATINFNLYTIGINSHKYLIYGCPSGGSSSTYSLYEFNTGSARDIGSGAIAQTNFTYNRHIGFRIQSGTVCDNLVFRPQLIDLTLWYGSNSRIPNDLTAEKFLQQFGFMDLQTYDTGTLVHTSTSSLTSIGYNQFDGEWELGTMANNIQTTNCKFKNYIKVIAGQTYTVEFEETTNIYVLEYDLDKKLVKDWGGTYATKTKTFQVGSNCQYIRIMLYDGNKNFTNAFPQNTCLHLTWSGSKTGYEKRYSNTYELPETDLMGIYGVSGDVMENGTTTRKYGVVDMGTLTWIYSGSYFRVDRIGTTSNPLNKTDGLVLCTKYPVSNKYHSQMDDKMITTRSYWTVNNIIVKDTDYTDVDTFKSAMSGVYLVYELATETTEDNDGFTTDIIVDDYGTLDFVGANGLPAVIDIDYQPNLVDYLRRVYLSINDPNAINSRLTTLETDVSALKTKVPTPPTTAGTYTLKVVVDSNGNPTYSWVSE